ncbi:hypothetical protein H0H93_013322 [Arthromyces matolae]|nr:hypothetical protein H0H93_013322 [Arthromyces matolae]
MASTRRESIRYVEIGDSGSEYADDCGEADDSPEAESDSDSEGTSGEESDAEETTPNTEAKPKAATGKRTLRLANRSDKDSFLMYAEPFLASAMQDGRVEHGVGLIRELWLDRFPNSMPDIAGLRKADPEDDPAWWSLHIKERMPRMGLLGRKKLNVPYVQDWEDRLSLASDREQRRKDYFAAASWGNYLTGHQYDVVITPETRQLTEISPEERAQRCLDRLLEFVKRELTLVMDPTQGSQIGGGPYLLRRTIKVTEHASPEARNNAQRRYANPDFDLPDPLDEAFEHINPFLTGPSSDVGSAFDLDESIQGLDSDTLLSLVSDAVTHYSPSSPLSQLSTPNGSPYHSPSAPENHVGANPADNSPENYVDTNPGDDSGCDEDKGDGDTDMGLDDDDKENLEPTHASPGRRTGATRESMNKAFLAIDSIFQQLALDVGLSTRQVHNAWLNSHGIAGTRTNWCRYQAYFAQHGEEEKQRVDNPAATASECYQSFKKLKNWDAILSTFDDLQHTDAGVTIRHRRRDFDGFIRRLEKLAKEMDKKQIDVYAVVVGNCVNEDAGLAKAVSTPGLQNLISQCLKLSEDEFLGFAKTEAFNSVATVASEDLARMRQDAASYSKPAATLSRSINADASNPAPFEIPKNATVDQLRNLCKAMLTTLFEGAGCPIVKKDTKGKGKGSARSEGHFPYNSLPQHISENGLKLCNWPFQLDFPATGKGPKTGIKCLSRIFLQKVEDPKAPIMVTSPPEDKDSQSHGDVLFADGTVERCSTSHGLAKLSLASQTCASQPSKPNPPPVPQTSSSTPPLPATQARSTRSRARRAFVAVGSSDEENSEALTTKGVRTALSDQRSTSAEQPLQPTSGGVRVKPTTSNVPVKPVQRRPFVTDGSSEEESGKPSTTDAVRPAVTSEISNVPSSRDIPTAQPDHGDKRRPTPRLKKATPPAAATSTPPSTTDAVRPAVTSEISNVPSSRDVPTTRPDHGDKRRPTPRLKKATPPAVATSTPPAATQDAFKNDSNNETDRIFQELEARARQAFPEISGKLPFNPTGEPFTPLLYPPTLPRQSSTSSVTHSTTALKAPTLRSRSNTPGVYKRTGEAGLQRAGSPPKKPRLSPVDETHDVIPDSAIGDAKAGSQPPSLTTLPSAPTPDAATVAEASIAHHAPPSVPAHSQPTPTHASEQGNVSLPPAGMWDPYHGEHNFYTARGGNFGFEGGYFGGPPGYARAPYEWPSHAHPHAPPPSNRSPAPASGFSSTYGPIPGAYNVPHYAYPNPHPHFLHPAYGGRYDAAPHVTHHFAPQAYVAGGVGSNPSQNASDAVVPHPVQSNPSVAPRE